MDSEKMDVDQANEISPFCCAYTVNIGGNSNKQNITF